MKLKHNTRYGLGAVASLLITMLASAALCCYNGLLVIPVASTVADGHYSFEYQTDGVVQGLTSDARLLNNEIGIGGRLELGVDLDLDQDAGSRAIGNAKYIAWRSHSGRIATAFGSASVARGIKPTPYVVSSAAVGAANLHLGVMHLDGSNCCITGIDRQIGKTTWMADYTSSNSGLASVGFNYQFRPDFAVMAGALFQRGGEDTGLTVHFVWCKSLKIRKGGN